MGKQDRKQYNAGRRAPATKEEVGQWLAILRNYRWSSYRAYAGYEHGPEWLTKEVLLGKDQGAETARSGPVLPYIRVNLRENYDCIYSGCCYLNNALAFIKMIFTTGDESCFGQAEYLIIQKGD